MKNILEFIKIIWYLVSYKQDKNDIIDKFDDSINELNDNIKAFEKEVEISKGIIEISGCTIKKIIIIKNEMVEYNSSTFFSNNLKIY